MHGNFFLQGTDRVVMPAVPLDQAYAAEFQIDAPLVEPLAIFQTALLHTTSSGASFPFIPACLVACHLKNPLLLLL